MEDVNQLIETFCLINKISVEEIKGRSRKGDIPIYRHILFYLIREKYPELRLTALEPLLKRDHSSISYGTKRIKELLNLGDKEIKHLVNKSRVLI